MSNRTECSDDGSFCLNGGVCAAVEEGSNSTDTSECSCVDFYSGVHCEIAPPPCTLKCHHGGSCQLGMPVSNMPWPGVMPSNEMYCSCLKGYSGYLCEYHADICGDYEQICLHGANCVDTAAGGYSCQCDAGDNYCQEHQGTQFCLPSTDTAMIGSDALEYFGGMAVPTFCFNGGKCHASQIDGQW